jgi:hypothetical protein
MGDLYMNIFGNLKLYASKWEVKSERPFNVEEINIVAKAIVVPSTYGLSVEFTMKNGGMTFIPLSQDASASMGEEIDVSKAKLITLSKQGEDDIVRVFI